MFVCWCFFSLQYLHEKHILHRDLKTQNVFLTRTNIIKVGDLGIARVLENQYDMASTLIGTPYYMSPELFSHKPYNYKVEYENANVISVLLGNLFCLSENFIILSIVFNFILLLTFFNVPKDRTKIRGEICRGLCFWNCICCSRWEFIVYGKFWQQRRSAGCPYLSQHASVNRNISLC